MPRKAESLDLLLSSYEELTRFGRGSLAKAYMFGGVVHALHRFYSYTDMGEVIGRHAVTVSMYDKLFKRYPTEQALLHMAEEMGTYDVGKLSKEMTPRAPTHLVYHCNNCGGTEFTKTREQAGEVILREPVDYIDTGRRR